MYQIVIVDQNAEIPIQGSKNPHLFRAPNVGEHIMVKWQGVTKVCPVDDVWTHVNLESQPPFQGAVQVIVRWSKGMDPGVFIRRYRG